MNFVSRFVGDNDAFIFCENNTVSASGLNRFTRLSAPPPIQPVRETFHPSQKAGQDDCAQNQPSLDHQLLGLRHRDFKYLNLLVYLYT